MMRRIDEYLCHLQRDKIRHLTSSNKWEVVHGRFNLLGMPISIYISVGEDERVGGIVGLLRNKTFSKRIP